MGPGPNHGQGRWEEPREDAFATPTLFARAVHVTVLEECEGCLRFTLDIEGRVGSTGADSIGLAGEMILRARLLTTTHEGAPALGVRFGDVESVRLEQPASMPAGSPVSKRTLEARIHKNMTDIIASFRGKPPQKISLTDRFKPGQGVQLEGVGLRSAATPSPEVFIGLNTNLVADGTVSFDERGGTLHGADWGLVLGDAYASLMIKRAIRAGRILTRYDRRGVASAMGQVAVDVDTVRFTPSGYEASVRLWYLGRAAFWIDYLVSGAFDIEEGQLIPAIEEVRVMGRGGVRWFERFVDRQATLEAAMRRVARRIPDELDLYLSTDLEAQLIPTAAETVQGGLVLYGRFNVRKQ